LANKKKRQQSRWPIVANIAKKELRLSNNEYPDVITFRGDRSSAALSISENGDLVKYSGRRSSLLLPLIVDTKCCYSELNGLLGQQAVIWLKAAMKMPSPDWILNASGGETTNTP
jgi:hypothetical protein